MIWIQEIVWGQPPRCRAYANDNEDASWLCPDLGHAHFDSRQVCQLRLNAFRLGHTCSRRYTIISAIYFGHDPLTVDQSTMVATQFV